MFYIYNDSLYFDVYCKNKVSTFIPEECYTRVLLKRLFCDTYT